MALKPTAMRRGVSQQEKAHRQFPRQHGWQPEAAIPDLVNAVAPETAVPAQEVAPEAVPDSAAAVLSSALSSPAVAEPGRLVDRVSAALLLTDLVALGLVHVLLPFKHLDMALLAMAILLAMWGNGLYRSRLTLSVLDDFPVICLAGVLATGFVTALLVSVAGHDPAACVRAGSLALGLILAGRVVTYAGIRWARKRGLVTYRTVIMGTGPTAAQLGRILDEHPETGLRLVGFLGPQPAASPRVSEQLLDERCQALPWVTREHRASVVLATLSGVSAEDVLTGIRSRDPRRPCTLFVVPPLFEVLHTPRAERIFHVPLIRLRRSVLAALPLRIKRVCDFAIAVVALLLASPVMLAVAIAVRLETGQGVLFRQERVGQNGELFTLLKFRSLRPATEQESGQLWSVSDDERMGPVGRFIRKTSLDELPQLINVLRGHMSIIGPRPERPYFVEQFGREYGCYALRHRVRPGLTGWAAVNGLRGDTSIEDRVYFDNAYIDNWSLWLDVKIVFRTVTAVVAGRGG